MMQPNQENLIRKQIMLSNNNIAKLEKIAKSSEQSVSKIVRTAVDNFDQDQPAMESSELMELVAARLKEAIKDTADTRKRLDRTLDRLEKEVV